MTRFMRRKQIKVNKLQETKYTSIIVLTSRMKRPMAICNGGLLLLRRAFEHIGQATVVQGKT